MARILGMEGKLYRNTGTHAVPVWDEVTNVRDLTLTLEKGEADVTNRANDGWRAMVGTLKESTVEFQMVWDTDDLDFSAFQDAFFNNTSVELAIMDGDISVVGHEGLRATFDIMTFTRTENLEEAMMVSVSCRPTYASNAPAWVEVAASGLI